MRREGIGVRREGIEVCSLDRISADGRLTSASVLLEGTERPLVVSLPPIGVFRLQLQFLYIYFFNLEGTRLLSGSVDPYSEGRASRYNKWRERIHLLR